MSNPIEAAFLRRQQERLDQLQTKKKNLQHRQKLLRPDDEEEECNDNDSSVPQQERDAIQSRRQQQFREWNDKLTQLSTDFHESNQIENHRALRMKLNQLQQELHTLRSELLVNSDDNTTQDKAAYETLVQCQQRWDETRRELFPPGKKFVFARYRAALQQQQHNCNKEQGQDNQPHSTGSESDQDQDDAAAQSNTTTILKEEANCLKDLENVDIVITQNSVHIQSKPDHGSFHDNVQPVQAPPTAFRNLKHCRVEFLCNNNKEEEDENKEVIAQSFSSRRSLHWMNCHFVEVVWGTPLQALHVTSCSDCTFDGEKIQQMRLHDSQRLTSYCRDITAGAILEGCREITLFYTPDEEMPIVRDFHWLKPGIPSPNFVMRPLKSHKKNRVSVAVKNHKDEKDGQTTVKQLENNITDNEVEQSHPETLQQVARSEDVEEEDDDDEI